MKRPLLLIANDDGYLAIGIRFLIDQLKDMADIVAIAPDRPRSAAGSSITTQLPVSAKKVMEEEGVTLYSCTGTPVDCLKLGINQYVDRQPDLVVSGINHGTNATINEHYSGTVAVAKEGTLQGIPSVEFSLDDFSENADFSPLAKGIRSIVKYVLEKGLPSGTLLNVNFPKCPSYRGIRLCRMAMGKWEDEFKRHEVYFGTDYYWIGGVQTDASADESTDSWAMEHGYVAVTPLKIDETDYAVLDRLTTDWPI